MMLRYLVKIIQHEVDASGKHVHHTKSTMPCKDKADALVTAQTIANAFEDREAIACVSFYGSRAAGMITIPISELRDLAEAANDAYTENEEPKPTKMRAV